VSTELPFSVDALYDGLVAHIDTGAGDTPFNLSNLPSADAYKAMQQTQVAMQQDTKKKPGAGPGAAPGQAAKEEAEKRANAGVELLRILGDIVPGQELGPLQHTCKPKALTESEAEYHVQVIKHMFRQHLVLEIYVSNTVQGVVLENIETKLKGLEPNWAMVGGSAIGKLEYDQQASAYVVLAKRGGEESAGVMAGSFGASLRFIIKEDGDDLGYDDDYPVENIIVNTGDYMYPRALPQGQFKSVWEQMAAQGAESTQKLVLNFKSLESAVDGIMANLNMEACDKTGSVETGVRGHTLLLSGNFLGGNMTLVKALVGMDPNHGCMAKLSCRAKNPAVCDIVARALM